MTPTEAVYPAVIRWAGPTLRLCTREGSMLFEGPSAAVQSFTLGVWDSTATTQPPAGWAGPKSDKGAAAPGRGRDQQAVRNPL